MEDNYNKEYYSKNKDFLLMLQRNKYATDSEYKQKTKQNASERYKKLTSTPEGREAYNAKQREYLRKYRANKKKK